mmetsp:Transcript_2722/g.6095  ORF Transcript_2722/g.6095 Transcript_2722/m.6095 type:complete len:217 (-) Transcript_2722:140-790(-)
MEGDLSHAEPPIDCFLGLQDSWHAVVQKKEISVCFHGDNRKGLVGRISLVGGMGSSLVIHSSEHDEAPPFPVPHEVRHLVLCPLVPTIKRHDTPPLVQVGLECRFRGDGFGAGVDDVVHAAGRSLPTGCPHSPSHHTQDLASGRCLGVQQDGKSHGGSSIVQRMRIGSLDQFRSCQRNELLRGNRKGCPTTGGGSVAVEQQQERDKAFSHREKLLW